ncbi:MAG TPA: TlpA disulfide reductase family protein [Metabacillus sp.]|nr:TlpA disulfide reductase family protein [Metabacillus sp.]
MNKTRFFKAILFIFLLTSIEMNNISRVNALNVNEEASDFTLETNKNQTIHLQDLKGKMVVLNFWTTWCTYCQEELAELQTFYEEKGDGVELIAVNLTASEQSKQGVLHFIDKSNIPFIVPMDVKGEVAKQYKIIGLPTTFIIDKKGKIKKKILGPITAELLHQYIDQL